MYQKSYKLVQVHRGKNRHDFAVRGNLHIVALAIHVTQAHLSLRVRLVEPGAQARITVVVVAHTRDQIAVETLQVHEAPSTTSDLLVKSVLSDRARCLYDGAIRVEKLAQKTNAYQRNENLLLSGRAYAESKPTLEILANDVRCTHGSTTGPIDPDQLWYITSRGISPNTGLKLITEGFIQSALMRVDDTSIIDELWQNISPAL